MSNLSISSQKLLREVLTRRNPALLKEMKGIARPPHELVDELCELVTDEFSATGLRSDDEPNERGLRLETLIDELRC